jgi:pilus assembly protein Flp/PilA
MTTSFKQQQARLAGQGKSMRQLFKMLRDCKGSTAIEYGLIGGLIAVAIILGFGAITENLGKIFDIIYNALASSTA